MLRLEKRYLDDIVAHARAGWPNEVCGLIAGKDGQTQKLYRMTNVDPNPRVRYQVDPQELLKVFNELDEFSWTPLAIYHSHPASPAYPSVTDVSLAYYPESYYVICSLQHEARPSVRAFRIVDRQITEEPVEVIEGA